MCGRKIYKFKKSFKNSLLLWLLLIGLMVCVWITYKRLPLIKLGRALGHKGRNVDPCFDLRRLKREVMEDQRKQRTWENSFYHKRANDFKEPIRVDTKQDETKCPSLYKVAREMLDGLKVRLPSETNNTHWKFRERIDLNELKKTRHRWNHPWEKSDSNEHRNYFDIMTCPQRQSNKEKY